VTYFEERLAAINGGLAAPPKRRRSQNRPPSRLQTDPKGYFADLYVRSKRQPDTKRDANWFDVRDAYKAGYEAALARAAANTREEL
jgi:hypothetical protein